ncbi:uncharacterized protein LOC112570579 [Pomacea canaliculata]|uniref:uncharacterized protein LOC112570579 n=1 Tax=Pomacea canaliculata TaxID=400727 RepID=UPI000D73E32B|nr:uncharacterized protein LOC112570579 [Pomacea canaliculata]
MGKIVYVGLLTFVLICTSTEEVDEKNTTVSKRMFAAFTEDNCLIDGKLYRHGTNFSQSLYSSCNKYHCENGVAKIIEEGCYYFRYKRCYPLGAIVVHECHTYTCVKRLKDKDPEVYRFRNIGPAKCKDYYGLCRLPGETSAFKKNGTLYPSCVCRQGTNGMLQFHCDTK